MRKFLFSALLSTCLAGAALAGNVPLQSGPWDPSNALGFLNGMIQSSNFNSGGILAALPAAVTTSGTGANTVLAYTFPTATFTQVGQGVRVTAFGTNTADANVKTITYNFGALAVACAVTGSGALWEVEFLVYHTGANTQISECHGQEGTTVVASVQPAAGSVSDAAPIASTLTATAATSGTTTVAGAFINLLK